MGHTDDIDFGTIIALGICSNIVKLAMIFCGGREFYFMFKGIKKVCPMLLYTYLGMIPRCFIFAMYFLSQLDENELSYWYIPVNFLGAFFAILFVSTAIIKNHYNILKVKLLLIVACISIAPFIVAYLFVGSEFFFVGLVIVEGLFMLIPFVFLHNIRIERDVSDFYLPIPICFFFVTVFNSIAGFLINDMALIMCGLSGSIPSTILLITYLVMSIRYKTTRIILQEQIIQIIQGEFVFYAAIIPSHKTVKTNMNYPKYYVQPENTLEIQDNKKSINQLDP